LKISRYSKAVFYQITAIILLIAAEILVSSMRTQGGLESAYFRSNTYLFIFSTFLLGTGVYSCHTYFKSKQNYKMDMLFILVIGLVLTIISVAIFISYGGLESPFDKTGFTAANINIMVISILPLLFIIRGLLISFSRATLSENTLRRVAIVFSLAVLVAYILTIAFGDLFKMLDYESDYMYSSFYSDNLSF
jgi:hypothetical protein